MTHCDASSIEQMPASGFIGCKRLSMSNDRAHMIFAQRTNKRLRIVLAVYVAYVLLATAFPVERNGGVSLHRSAGSWSAFRSPLLAMLRASREKVLVMAICCDSARNFR
jgi:hypothetical protein